MSSGARRHLDELLAATLERSPEERSRYLSEACGDDAELRAEVESILSAESDSGPFDRLFSAFDEASRHGSGDELEPGARLGPYLIERLLGRGGMGAVFLARRVDGQFEQEVAVKVLNRDGVGVELRRRFLAERQILARLSHPGIARVFDGGVTTGGRPYLVMEYVEGTPIDLWCDERRLEVDARLRLFLAVCDAVEHAHRHQVVHRDLKPTNLLVTRTGLVKLLDFGIAKLLDPEAFGQPGAPTCAQLCLMTPEYASPEQVRGGSVGTASDVYQLGVLLFELLSGHRPHPLGPSWLATGRAICEIDPPRPSSVVARESARRSLREGAPRIAAASIAAARGTTREGLRQRLRGDLDSIVLKALRKEPEGRYRDVREMTTDIERHLEGRPVQARAATAPYRISRFVSRHRVGVGLTVALAVAMLLTVASVRSTVTTAAQSRATERKAAAVSQVTNILLGLFEANGDSLSARDLLARGVERADRESDRPALQARMLYVIGNAYGRLGAFDRAAELLRRSVAVQRQLHPGADPDLAESLADLGEALRYENELSAADSSMTAGLHMRRALGDSLQVASSLDDLAWVALDRGEFRKAEAYAREGLSIRRRALGDGDVNVSYSLTNLGMALAGLGLHAEAEESYRRSLAIQERSLGTEHPETMWTRIYLADALRDEGRYAEAEPLLRRILSHEGVLPVPSGGSEAGEQAWQPGSEIRGAVQGGDPPYVASSPEGLAPVVRPRDPYEEAEPLVRTAWGVAGAASGGDAEARAVPNRAVATALVSLSAGREAERRLRGGLAPLRGQPPTRHEYISRPLLALGELLTATDRAEEARPLLEETLSIRQRAFGSGNWRVSEAESALGSCLLALGRLDSAEPHLLRGWRGMVAARGADDPISRRALRGIIGLYEARVDSTRAALYRRQLDTALSGTSGS